MAKNQAAQADYDKKKAEIDARNAEINRANETAQKRYDTEYAQYIQDKAKYEEELAAKKDGYLSVPSSQSLIFQPSMLGHLDLILTKN